MIIVTPIVKEVKKDHVVVKEDQSKLQAKLLTGGLDLNGLLVDMIYDHCCQMEAKAKSVVDLSQLKKDLVDGEV